MFFSPKTFQLKARGDQAEVYGLPEKCTLKTKGKGGKKVSVKVLLPRLINAAPGGLRGTFFGGKKAFCFPRGSALGLLALGSSLLAGASGDTGAQMGGTKLLEKRCHARKRRRLPRPPGF